MSAESGSSRFWTNWPRRIALGLIGLELAYVAGFEVAARTGLLERWANRRPEKIAIAFAGAHSWFPCWATVRGLEVRGQTPKMRWRLQADEGSGWLAPLPLVQKRIRVASAHARGIAFQMRLERPGEVLDAATEALLPQIPPLAPPPATPRPARRKWTFEFPRAGATGVRELWADRLRLTGDMAASGGGALFAGIEAEVFPSGVDLVDGRLTLGELELASGIRGHVDAAIARWPFKEKKGLAAMPFVSARVAVEGSATVGAFANAMLLPEFVRFGHQPAPFAARIELREGVVQPGTLVELERTACQLTLYEQFGVTGQASARVEVASDGEGPRGDLTLRFADFELRQVTDPRPEIVGTGLTVLGRTRDLGIHEPPYTATARVDLGEARLADLAVYDRLIPESLPLAILGGSGRVQGGLDASFPEFSARGRFEARIEGAAVRYDALDLQGNVQVDLPVATADLASRRFDFSGLRLALEDFRSPQVEAAGPQVEEGWWATIELPEGRLALPPSPAADGRFVVKLRDSVPLVGLFATQRDLPRWVERVLSVKDLGAEGRIGWSPEALALEDFSTRFRKSTIRAKARFAKDRKAGVMMIEWWRLALGARFDDDRRKFKLRKVRDWFAQQDLGALPTVEAAGAEEVADEPAETAGEATSLAGTRWRLAALVPPSPAISSLGTTVTFDATAVRLESVCGSAATTWSSEPGGDPKIAAFETSTLDCGEPLASDERRVRALLTAAGVLSRAADELVLSDGDGPEATQLLFSSAMP